MSSGRAVDEQPDAFTELAPLVRRVVSVRVRDPHLTDDLVQETLARVMAARPRLEDSALAPYAVVTARNLIFSMWQREGRDRRHAHRLVDLASPPAPDEELLKQEETAAVAVALAQLSERERKTLVAHEVDGEGTASLATSLGSTPGAVAVQLSRVRAKLRVEYLLALEGVEPPTPQCRPVLLSLSAGDRRRQRELDTPAHLLGCSYCSAVRQPLLRRAAAADAEGCIPISTDADVVRARQQGRRLAAQVGFSTTDLTLIATAISEVARNIVRFAERGEILVRVVELHGRNGVTIVARDVGPGIPDVTRALTDGYSTYHGLGLGLPGSRRLMDEFGIISEVGKGTTVTMTKWRHDP